MQDAPNPDLIEIDILCSQIYCCLSDLPERQRNMMTDAVDLIKAAAAEHPDHVKAAIEKLRASMEKW